MANALSIAVSESIAARHIGTPRIEYTGTAAQLLADLRVIAADADYSTENDGTLDCYGTVDGDSFRLAVMLVAG